jgi:hypothetical protein
VTGDPDRVALAEANYRAAVDLLREAIHDLAAARGDIIPNPSTPEDNRAQAQGS